MSFEYQAPIIESQTFVGFGKWKKTQTGWEFIHQDHSDEKLVKFIISYAYDGSKIYPIIRPYYEYIRRNQ